MKIRIGPLAMAVLVAMLLAAPAAAREQRPITGQFTAQAAPAAPRCGQNAFALGYVIEGTAAHLGALTGSGSNCTELTFASTAVAIWDGVATFTAADGSTLTSTSTGTQGTPVAGLATFLTTHDITGGTARFAGADGVWTVSGVIDFTTGQLTGVVDGWLSY